MAKSTVTTARTRRREKKNITSGVAHVNATFNNTLITISDAQGNAISWSSAGSQGFRGSRKSTPYAAQMAAEDAGRKAQEHGMTNLEIEVKGPNREIIPVLEEVNGVQEVVRVPVSGGAYHRYHITVELGLDIRTDLAKVILENDWELFKLQSLGMSLEEIFLRLTLEEESLPHEQGEA